MKRRSRTERPPFSSFKVYCERRAEPRGALGPSCPRLLLPGNPLRLILAIAHGVPGLLLRKIPLAPGRADLLLLDPATRYFQIFADEILVVRQERTLHGGAIAGCAVAFLPALPFCPGLADLNCSQAAAADQHFATISRLLDGRDFDGASSSGHRHGGLKEKCCD